MIKVMYKRSAKGEPLTWQIEDAGDKLIIRYGILNNALHEEELYKTFIKANEFDSRVKAKRKEGYKELFELKDSSLPVEEIINDKTALYNYVNTYLPKYNSNEGFVLPMLAKTLEDNKPFEKTYFLGQWKINGLRCLIGCEKVIDDMFTPYRLTYHSREGVDWTSNMCWMDEVILPKLSSDLKDMMIEEGAMLDGELYLPGYSVNDINSFVKNTTLKEHYLLQYWCYDIAVENMSASARTDFRTGNIAIPITDFTTKQEHLNNKKQVILLPTEWYVTSIREATKLRDAYIGMGFEGLILRNHLKEYQFDKRNQAMFKFKKVDDGKFVIVDIKSEHKRSDLPLFVCRNDINDELFECSINTPHDVQREILANKNNYIGKYMFVEYRERSGVNELPFHARGIKII